ncbi:MAG: hypothetical protein PHH16_04330 [Candidatus Gracilibacteria bacterium]|nr:hypothetical protein [Candidatus Gracilibacteria bacterium]
MKPSLRIIAIGSIFLLCGASVFGIISLKDKGISSGFWNMRQIATVVYADDDRGEENEDDDREERRIVNPLQTAVAPAANDISTTQTVNANTDSSTGIIASSSAPMEYTAPNGRKYTIHPLSTGAYIFERPDGSVSSQKFTSYQNTVDFIDKNNHQVEEVAVHTAPNGSVYTILNDLTTETYMFRRANGSVSNGYFATRDVIMAYIDKNNPLVPAKIAIVKKTIPTIKRAVTVLPKAIPVTIVKAPTASVAVNSAQTSSAAALAAQQKAQAAAAAQQAAMQKQAQAQAAAAALAAQQKAQAAAQAQAAAAQKVNTTTSAS